MTPVGVALLPIGPGDEGVHEFFTWPTMGIFMVEHTGNDKPFAGTGVHVSGDGRHVVDGASLDMSMPGAQGSFQSVSCGAINTHDGKRRDKLGHEWNIVGIKQDIRKQAW